MCVFPTVLMVCSFSVDPLPAPMAREEFKADTSKNWLDLEVQVPEPKRAQNEGGVQRKISRQVQIL